MPDQLQYDSVPNQSGYFLLWSAAGQVRSGTGFVNYLSGSRHLYAISVTEGPPGHYMAGVPAVPPGILHATAHLMQSGLPTEIDTPAIAVGSVPWNGSGIGVVVTDYSSGKQPLLPVESGRRAAVNASGQIGIDWGNVGNQNTSVILSGTIINQSGQVNAATISGFVRVGDISGFTRVGDLSGFTRVNDISGFTRVLDISGMVRLINISGFTRIADLQQFFPARLSKGVAFSFFKFRMTSSSDHVTPATGLTVTAQRSIDNGVFAACSNAVSEIGSGWYQINLSAADLNGNCIALKFTATGADQLDITVITQNASG